MQTDKAGIAPAFPANHLAGTKADRVMDTKDGLTAWEVMRLLFPKRLRRGVMAEVPSFQGQLREGSWYATGYRVSSMKPKPERISRDLWDILEIDLDSNTASSRVLEYEGLRFYEKKKVGKFLSLLPVRRADLKLFMEQRIADLKERGGKSSASKDETAAREHFNDRSINRDWIKEIRKEIGVPPDWSKRGRRN